MLDTTVLLGVVMFTVTVVALVAMILFARSRLVSSGNVTILINDDPEKAIEVPAGGKLLGTLAAQGYFWPVRVVAEEPVLNAGAASWRAAAVSWPPKRGTSIAVKFPIAGVFPARLQ